MVFVQVDETLRQESADSLLHFRGFGMDETAAEGIARGLVLLGREAIAKLMQHPAEARDHDENDEDYGKRAEGFDKKRLHYLMIPEESAQ